MLSGFIPNNAGLIIMMYTCTRVRQYMTVQGGEGGNNCIAFLHLTFEEKTGEKDVDLKPELTHQLSAIDYLALKREM